MSSLARPRERLALPALLLGGFAVGFSPIFVRLSELGPTATGFYRLFLALPVLLIWMRWEARGPVLPSARPPLMPLTLPGLLFAGDLFFWHRSINDTTIANSTLLANFAPIIVTVGAWLYLRERITLLFLAGMALAMAGAALLIGASFDLGPRYVLGDGYGLITAGFFGSYMVAVARLRGRYAASTIMFWSSAVTCAVLLVATLLSGEGFMPRAPSGWVALFALAWVSQTMGQGMIAYALGLLPASFSALVILIEPLTAAILGWAWLGEALGTRQVAGGIVVLAGIVVARRASRVAAA